MGIEIWLIGALLCLMIAAQYLTFRRLGSLRNDAEQDVLAEHFTALSGAFDKSIVSMRDLIASKSAEIDIQGRANTDKIKTVLDMVDKNSKDGLKVISSTLDTRLQATAEALSSQERRALEGQKQQLDVVHTRLNEQSQKVETTLRKLEESIERKLTNIQTGNEKKLEEMRHTVDEKLSSTLNQRIEASFKQVVTNLESVQRGLGEMQTLAQGVGSLNRILANTKVRGVFGETQLESVLTEVLRPDQYERKFKPKPGSNAQVEFAVRLPGPKNNSDSPLYIPIDAKFPKEDYERLRKASEDGDKAAEEAARKALLRRIHNSAKEIKSKYINPPVTTNFAIMFLATEGLYAEALREPGFHEMIRRDGIIITGPTTLSAILNSLAIGFHTLAMEKRTQDIIKVLGAVKTGMGTFAKALNEVNGFLDKARIRTTNAINNTNILQGKLHALEGAPAENETNAKKNTEVIETDSDVQAHSAPTDESGELEAEVDDTEMGAY